MRPRRLPRLLLNAATAVSLALCLLTLVLWPRSHRYSTTAVWREVDFVNGRTGWRFTKVVSAAGCVCVQPNTRRAEPTNWFDLPDPTRGRREFEFAWSEENPTYPGYSGPDFGGFQFKRFEGYTPPQVYEGHALTVPHWFIATAAILLPVLRTAGAVRTRWHRRTRGATAHLCPTCHYDLRATPTRCPECGQSVSALTPSPTTPPARSGAHP